MCHFSINSSHLWQIHDVSFLLQLIRCWASTSCLLVFSENFQCKKSLLKPRFCLISTKANYFAAVLVLILFCSRILLGQDEDFFFREQVTSLKLFQATCTDANNWFWDRILQGCIYSQQLAVDTFKASISQDSIEQRFTYLALSSDSKIMKVIF